MISLDKTSLRKKLKSREQTFKRFLFACVCCCFFPTLVVSTAAGSMMTLALPHMGCSGDDVVTVPSSASCFDTLWTDVTVDDSKICSGRTFNVNPIVCSIKSVNSHWTKWSLHKRGRDVHAGRSQHQHLNCTNLIHFLHTARQFHGKECSSGIFCYLWIVALCGNAQVTVSCRSHVEHCTKPTTATAWTPQTDVRCHVTSRL